MASKWLSPRLFYCRFFIFYFFLCFSYFFACVYAFLLQSYAFLPQVLYLFATRLYFCRVIRHYRFFLSINFFVFFEHLSYRVVFYFAVWFALFLCEFWLFW